jgi:curli biogenesis system outer membrane secretion channel CsgG
MKKIFARSFGVLTVIALLIQPSYAAGKKKICVMDLEDKTQGQHSGWQNVGRGMSDMLVTALIQSKKFIVIEREQLEKVMNEQALGQTGAVNPQTAAKIGQVLGVSYIVTGSVTEFGIKESKLGVGNLGRMLPFGGGVDTKTNKAVVAMDVRMINTSTAQIEKAVKGDGEEKSTGVSIDLDVAPSVDFGKDGFDETVIGKAVRKAVDMVAKNIIESELNAPWSARIIKVNENQIYLNSGEDDGEKPGRVVGIYRKSEELIDPETGISLGSEEKKLGTAKIVKVEKQFSIAETDAGGVTKDDYLKEEK